MDANFAEELRSLNLKEHIATLDEVGITCADDVDKFTDEMLQEKGLTFIQCVLVRQAAEDCNNKAGKPKPQKSTKQAQKPTLSKKAPVTSSKQPESEAFEEPGIKIEWATFPKRSVHQVVSCGSVAALSQSRIGVGGVNKWPGAGDDRSTDIPWVRASNAQRAGELIANGKTSVRCGGPDLPRTGPSYNKGENRIASLDSITLALKESKLIHHLDLGGYHLGSPGGLALAEALKKNHSLWHLDLGGCALGLEGGSAIAKVLQKNRTILHLNLRENALGSEGAAAIAAVLEKNQFLKHLDLSHNQFGPEGGCTIAKALGLNTSLQHLNLGYNALGSEGGKALAESLGLGTKKSSVQYLDLRHNNIKAEGIQAITSAIRKNPSFTLRDIMLAGNALCSRDTKALTGALRLNRTIFYRPSPYYD